MASTLNEFLERALSDASIASSGREPDELTERIKEFRAWAKKKGKVTCWIVDNQKEICKVSGKITLSKEDNSNGYPRDFTITGSGVDVNTSYWYINGLYKTQKGGWMVIVDGYHNYMLS